MEKCVFDPDTREKPAAGCSQTSASNWNHRNSNENQVCCTSMNPVKSPLLKPTRAMTQDLNRFLLNSGTRKHAKGPVCWWCILSPDSPDTPLDFINNVTNLVKIGIQSTLRQAHPFCHEAPGTETVTSTKCCQAPTPTSNYCPVWVMCRGKRH